MKLLTNLTLQKKISLLILISLIFSLGLFSWLGVQSLNESTQRTLDERLTITRVVVSHLDEIVYHILFHVKNSVSSQEALPSEAQFLEKARALVALLTESNIIAKGVFLLNSSGKIILELYQFKAIGLELPGYSDISPVISRQASISSLVYAPQTEVPVVFATAPIRDSDERYIGALSVAIDVNMSSISGFIKPITLGNTGYVEIVDKNGVVLARTEPGQPPKAFERSDHPGRFAQLMDEGKATVRTCHRCHGPESQPQRRRDVIAFAPLSAAPWGVAIRQSEEEAFAITEQLKKRLLLFGGIILTGMFLVVWLFMQGVVIPIKMLTSAAAKVATGDFKAWVPIHRRDEIGQLSAAFASMTRDLERAHIELVSRNQELLALNSIAATVSLSLDMEDILAKATQKVLAITGAESGCVFLSNIKSKDLTMVCYIGSSNLFRCMQACSPTANCACHQVLHYGHALLVNDVSQCPALSEEIARQKGITSFVSVPLKSKDKVLGVMNAACSTERYFTEGDFELMHSIGYHVGLAVENSLLYQETRQKEELRGQLLNAIINAQEEERKRISRDLHDGCAQTLTGLIMSIESIENLTTSKIPAITQRLASTRQIATRVLEDMRNIMRGLRSIDFDEIGLVEAIRSNAVTLLEAADIVLDFETQNFNGALPLSIKTALFRIVQEAVYNIIKHSEARTVIIRMKMEDSRIIATIRDDGRGFDPIAFFGMGRKIQSLGLLGMQERATLLGGTLSITSAPGKGTHIIVEIPVDTSQPIRRH